MKFRQFTNTKGMTLVELLAALSLFAVVIALSSTVIIQMVNGESKTSDDISLKQETNVLISELRNDYEEKLKDANSNETFHICLQNESAALHDLIINGASTVIENGCTAEEFGTGDPLNIKLITQNSSGGKLELETSFRSESSIVPLEITLERNEDDNTDPEKIDWIPVSEEKCEYDHRTLLTDLHFKHNMDCEEDGIFTVYKVNGDAKIENNVKFQVKTKLIIKGDLYLTDKTNIVVNGGKSYNKGEICVEAEGGIHYPPNKTESDFEGIFSCT
ncbi:PulJ/GspJ family protein [Oceanobacillus damuensis]|uniref:PulJ/GspJ family protein n=1 Tax=Oceanobacillus damuensis TaxID=937928 RepID=UPI00083215E6|nr:prepilin-type N-terminal cleavage/methylation domain-containing protein [Oceanobacillus damuensis]